MNKIISNIKLISSHLGFNRFIIKHCPKWHASRLYKRHFNRAINWNSPSEFNEKLRWLQFYTDTSKWTLLADKYRVREYLTNMGYGDMLVKLYGVWVNADDIDFSKLPDKFVLKTNHGCGSVYVINDKNKEDIGIIKKQLNKDLNAKYGISTAEPHYYGINPVIIAEEKLIQNGSLSKSLIDYKIYCINGEPQFCGVMYNRNVENHTYEIKLYDNDWNDISIMLGSFSHTHIGDICIPKPKNYEKMKQFCRNICKEFSFVRMDFYECNGKLYFGEFTFTPAACTGAPLGVEACKYLSDRLVLPKNKKKFPLS